MKKLLWSWLSAMVIVMILTAFLGFLLGNSVARPVFLWNAFASLMVVFCLSFSDEFAALRLNSRLLSLVFTHAPIVVCTLLRWHSLPPPIPFGITASVLIGFELFMSLMPFAVGVLTLHIYDEFKKQLALREAIL